MRSAHFATLVARQPENELFRFSLAQALLAEQRPAEALQHLEACANKKPDWMMPRILLGKALLGLGRPTDAKPWLESALQLAITQDHEDPARELQALLADLAAKPPATDRDGN
jgi:predicted Zn-dependent protease